MNKLNKTLISVVIIVILLFIFNTSIFAIEDYSSYDPTSSSITGTSTVTSMLNPIIGMIKTVGIILAVIALILIGFQYMTGSLAERAEYKKKLLPYFIGIVLLVSITQIIGLIYTASNSALNSGGSGTTVTRPPESYDDGIGGTLTEW